MRLTVEINIYALIYITSTVIVMSVRMAVDKEQHEHHSCK